jgi:hypothetical protein
MRESAGETPSRSLREGIFLSYVEPDHRIKGALQC